MYNDPYNVPGFEFFGETDGGGSYDWSVFGAWLKNGQFYWAFDAGCSCNSPWDHLDLPGDFSGPGSAHDAIKALHTWISEPYNDGSESLMTKLLDYKP